MLDVIVAEEHENIKMVAGLNKGRLLELVVHDAAKANEGDVYLGKIVKKISTANGKNSYFVNIGKRDVFINAHENELEDLDAHEGQDIVLQIAQEARAEKNARGLRFLQLAGDNIVFCPYGNGVNISSKIENEELRNNLSELVSKNLSEDDGGWIVRTHAAEVAGDEIISEMSELRQVFADIMVKAKAGKSPECLYSRDNSLSDMISRNMSTLCKIVVNNHNVENEFADTGIVEYNADAFSEYGIDEQIGDALQKEVKLKCGGRIFIEETKALTAIDVDSGGCSGQGGINRLNNEAAEEIAKQIILRNLSGKIVIDFAGFTEFKFLKDALDILEQGLQDDVAKSRVLGVTKAGNVEILRSRRRPSLSDIFMKECEVCQGTGRVEK